MSPRCPTCSTTSWRGSVACQPAPAAHPGGVPPGHGALGLGHGLPDDLPQPAGRFGLPRRLAGRGVRRVAGASWCWAAHPAVVQGCAAVFAFWPASARATSSPSASARRLGAAAGAGRHRRLGALLVRRRASSSTWPTPSRQLPDITFWLLGGLWGITWPDVLQILPVVIPSLIVLYLMRWRLNLLSMRDETAFSLGVRARPRAARRPVRGRGRDRRRGLQGRPDRLGRPDRAAHRPPADRAPTRSAPCPAPCCWAAASSCCATMWPGPC